MKTLENVKGLVNTSLLTVVHESRVHDKFAGYKLLLSGLNWNDYGYYTSFGLWLQLPKEKEFNLKIADLNIITLGQEAGDIPSMLTEQHMFTFIKDVESAYMILFYLTYEERKELISRLNISFQYEAIKNEPVFQKSVLRGMNEEDFMVIQAEIERIVSCPLNISVALVSCKDQMDFYNHN